MDIAPIKTHRDYLRTLKEIDLSAAKVYSTTPFIVYYLYTDYSVPYGLAIVIALVCFLGLTALLLAVIPLVAILPILLFIGLVIGAQAFQATDTKNALVLGTDGKLWLEHAPFGSVPSPRQQVDANVALR